MKGSFDDDLSKFYSFQVVLSFLISIDILIIHTISTFEVEMNKENKGIKELIN